MLEPNQTSMKFRKSRVSKSWKKIFIARDPNKFFVSYTTEEEQLMIRTKKHNSDF